MCVSHSLCICLLRCEGKFYSLCLPKVPGTQWMPNACLFSEWMKTVKIMNEKHPESCIWWGTNNGSTTEWRWRFTTADSHNGGREGLPWERVFPSTARIITTDPESSARKYMAIPETPKERSAFVWGYHAESYQLCLLSSGLPWIPPSWFSLIAPAPLCAQVDGVSFLFVAFKS